MNSNYYNKYIKYKTKYIELKKIKQIGGNNDITGESIRGIISAALKGLEDRGKRLSQDDLQKINEQINDVIRSEDELKVINIRIDKRKKDVMRAKDELVRNIR